MEYFHEQLAMLKELGLTHDNTLTPLGKDVEKWIGRADLAYAVQLQRCLTEEATPSDIIFWVVLTALSTTPIVTLRARYDYFVDRDGSHTELPHSMDVWSHWIQHEDVSMFRMFAQVAGLQPNVLFGSKLLHSDDTVLFNFEKWCNYTGLDARKLRQAGRAVSDAWRLFCQINGDSPEFRKLFGDPKSIKLTSIPWLRLRRRFPETQSWTALYRMPGTTSLWLVFDEDLGGYQWRDMLHGHHGVLFQDDTPIPLREGGGCKARLTPGRQTKGDETSWRVSHLGYYNRVRYARRK